MLLFFMLISPHECSPLKLHEAKGPLGKLITLNLRLSHWLLRGYLCGRNYWSVHVFTNQPLNFTPKMSKNIQWCRQHRFDGLSRTHQFSAMVPRTHQLFGNFFKKPLFWHWYKVKNKYFSVFKRFRTHQSKITAVPLT